MRDVVLVVALAAVLCLPLVLLTARGARVRGSRPALSVLSGIGFPVTWVVWYVLDASAPGHRAGSRSR